MGCASSQPEPILCAAGCGNYGHPSTGNYCRTCYDQRISASKGVEYPGQTKTLSSGSTPMPTSTAAPPATYPSQPPPATYPQPQYIQPQQQPQPVYQSPSPPVYSQAPPAYQPPSQPQQPIYQQPQPMYQQPYSNPAPATYQPTAQAIPVTPAGQIQITCPNSSCRCLLNAPAQPGVQVQCPRCHQVFTHGTAPQARPVMQSQAPIQSHQQSHTTIINNNNNNNNGGGGYYGGGYGYGGAGVGLGVGLIGGMMVGAALSDMGDGGYDGCGDGGWD